MAILAIGNVNLDIVILLANNAPFFLGMQAHDTCYSPDLAVSLANNLLPKFSTNSLYCNDTQQIFLGKYHFSMMAKAF